MGIKKRTQGVTVADFEEFKPLFEGLFDGLGEGTPLALTIATNTPEFAPFTFLGWGIVPAAVVGVVGDNTTNTSLAGPVLKKISMIGRQSRKGRLTQSSRRLVASI
jgi:hypothetical protein